MDNSRRYIRQTTLLNIGTTGQKRLAKTRVCIIGCGGLGSVVAPYLAGAGVGQITLVDHDALSITNLHRQVIYTESMHDSKAHHLQQHIEAQNSEISAVAISERITKSNISAILSDMDLVIECTDDIYTKYLVNDYCHLHHIPMIYGALSQYSGYVSLFENKSEQSIHLRDIFAEPSDEVPTCADVGVLGTAAGLIGMLQANEALKYILSLGTSLSGRLLTYDVRTYEQMILSLRKTYTKDMSNVYASSTYEVPACASSAQISWQTISADRDHYHIVSILESYEHESIDDRIDLIPLSEIDIETIAPRQNTVYYCQTGKRSMALVSQILKRQPDAQVFSLEGGIQGLEPTQ